MIDMHAPILNRDSTDTPTPTVENSSHSHLVGAQIYGRVLGVVAAFKLDDSTSGPRLAETGWREARGCSSWNVWQHEAFPKYLAYDAGDSAIVLHRKRSRLVNMQTVSAIGRLLTGRSNALDRLVLSPAALRLPLRLFERAAAIEGLDLPEPGSRCQRIGKSRTMSVDGVEVEMRLSGGVSRNGTITVFAEAFLTGRHETIDGEPRAFLFDADLRKLPRLREAELEHLISSVSDILLRFGDAHRNIGLMVDVKARLPGPPIVMVCPAENPHGIALKLLMPTL